MVRIDEDLHKELKKYAEIYLKNHIAVMPAKLIEKRPSIGYWKKYQAGPPTSEELDGWFKYKSHAICILTGKTSGNLEALDFDFGGEAFEAWAEKVKQKKNYIIN